jgi:hypothetical protein
MLATTANASDGALGRFLANTQVDGEARAYYFTRSYSTGNTPDADAFSLAVLLNIRTGEFAHGFSVGGSFFTAHALGTQNSDPRRVDVTLTGHANSVNALGQAYVQYHASGVLLKAGDQLLDTPWAGRSDARVLPATYQAAYSEWAPLEVFKLEALRILEYKGRTAGDYFRDNNYYPATYEGDANYGATSNLPMHAPSASGALAGGATYHVAGLKGTAWFYDFYQFGRMAYLDDQFTFPAVAGITPFLGAQAVREWGEQNMFARTGMRFFGQPGTKVDSRAYGAIVGAKHDGVTLSLAYDKLDSRGSDALGGGVLISPYTTGYATDPLYTTSMVRGLVELGPGSAWRAKASWSKFANQLELVTAFARYRTDFSGNDTQTYFDVKYSFRGFLKGLSIRDRIEIGKGRVNPGGQAFVYNRVQLAYAF